MSLDTSAQSRRALRGGVAADHEPLLSLPILVGPATSGESNTIRPALRPIACWRLEDLRFDFDSSAVRPDAASELTLLAALWKRVGNPPMSIFGHADPVGDDEYNKSLSGRRALAIYALLTRDTDKWESLYSKPLGGDDWKARTVPMMVNALGFEDVKSFQKSQGLRADGIAGPKTRKPLFAAYMDAICKDEAGQPFRVDPTDFLAHGDDPDGKGDYQGCSEFNPILLFSAQENQQLSQNKPERNAQNAPNRRVLIFLFPRGVRINPELWPCPRAKEGSAGCRKMFWPDGDKRRSFQERRREYDKDKDTFACAFYESMARRSPCESSRRSLRIRLFGPDKQPIPDAPYRLTVLATGEVRSGNVADANGVVSEDNLLAPSQLLIQFGDPRFGKKPTPLGYELRMFLEPLDGPMDEPGARRRLNNLGYTHTEFLSDAVRAFQRDYELNVNGELDDTTKRALAAAADRGKSKSDIAAGDFGNG